MSDLMSVMCRMCERTDDLVLVTSVTGRIVIGVRIDGQIVGDGGPETYDLQESQAGQYIWCASCCTMTTLDLPYQPDDAGSADG